MLKHLVLDFAAIDPVVAGGVATFCQGIARHLPPRLEGVEAQVLLGHTGWAAHCPLPESLPELDLSHTSTRRMGFRLLESLDPSAPLTHRFSRGVREAFRRPAGFPKALAAQTLIHCPYQVVHPLVPRAWPLPYVINLHDIQHEHFPEFFSPGELAWRRRHYLASAQHAAAVCVVDEWTRRDLLSYLPLDPEKVFVAPLGPTWSEAPPLKEAELTLEPLGLPRDFLYYPAQTWPHKNHLRLFEALKHLKDRGLPIPLVCSGHLTDHHANLQRTALEAGLEIHFLGLQPQSIVQALYAQSRAVVIPTLFEGGSGIPVLEAMSFGKALAASAVCGIPDAVGEAALLFDPMDPAAMAEAIQGMWEDAELRGQLSARALRQAKAWSWDRTAAAYRDIYREVLARWKQP